MRALIMGFAAFVFAAVGTVTGNNPASAQSGYDRPGGDYASAPVPSGDPAVCAARCERDKSCRSWSFAYPSASGEPAMCWLKRIRGTRAAASCCVSGVRGAGRHRAAAGRTRIFDGPHGRRLPILRNAARPARQSLRWRLPDESRCRAWTYRRPGYGTAAPRCYLKDTIKAAAPAACCISGVVR